MILIVTLKITKTIFLKSQHK